MNRPWKIWLVFALCAAVMLAVIGWVSWTALKLDRAQARAQAEAELEGNIRLALWRMDSMLGPLLAQESARPYAAYRPFHPVEGIYSKALRPLGEVVAASPLLTQVSTNILLHFQFDPRGQLTSPQVPTGKERELAEGQFTTRERIELAAARLRGFERLMAQRQVSPPGQNQRQNSFYNRSGSASGGGSKPANLSNKDVLFGNAPRPEEGASILNRSAGPVVNPALQMENEAPEKASKKTVTAQKQSSLNKEELQKRAQSVQQNYDLNVRNTMANVVMEKGGGVAEGLFKAVWFGDSLVLVRRVAVGGQEYVQGCWLDWPGIRASLLDVVKDLLPAARLEPVNGNLNEEPARILATLPLRLIPDPALAEVGAVTSPILFALLLAWGCVIVAGVAVGVLLHGTLSLSERRAAFVSAVTHELRTPLTTFKMYSEMLAGGMVPDEAKRQTYLSTLCAEANRLNHLVENVLAYARLERGSARSRIEKVTFGELIERAKPRLVQRAEQAGMKLQEDIDPGALNTVVQVDVGVVEQILFNLVDNACKYAAPGASEKIIYLEALPENGSRQALLRVRDHGQGISAEAARRLFRPFSKSAHEAARTASGVGLGLALCRRLSRSLGGDLRFNSPAAGGAAFELLLPVA